ncbi:MAG: nucleotide exchange factor GrpE [Clostridia bacterium]|nr:nucleotide exchange factor GrpE [Clostridia bacterium]
MAKGKHEEKHESNEPNYLEMAQRIQAEFENYKKRNATISQDSYRNGVMAAVRKMLPVIDSFKQAKGQIKDESVLSGLDLVLGQMMNALKDLGVTKIECVGLPFDPNYHNAVLVGKDSHKEDGIVLEEYQEGFIMGDNVIRHSVVKINKLS